MGDNAIVSATIVSATDEYGNPLDTFPSLYAGDSTTGGGSSPNPGATPVNAGGNSFFTTGSGQGLLPGPGSGALAQFVPNPGTVSWVLFALLAGGAFLLIESGRR